MRGSVTLKSSFVVLQVTDLWRNEILKSFVEITLDLCVDDSQTPGCRPATLSIRVRVTKTRTASHITLPAFLSSTTASSELVTE